MFSNFERLPFSVKGMHRLSMKLWQKTLINVFTIIFVENRAIKAVYHWQPTTGTILLAIHYRRFTAGNLLPALYCHRQNAPCIALVAVNSRSIGNTPDRQRTTAILVVCYCPVSSSGLLLSYTEQSAGNSLKVVLQYFAQTL